jgi:F-type H+-transporting ATPase subunit b
MAGYVKRTVPFVAILMFASARAFGEEGGTHESPSLFTGDLGNIFWSLLTFIAVLVVLGKFAWKPILGALQKREEFIRESLKKAQRDREESEARLKEYMQKIEAARAEAMAIVQEGRRDAEVLKHRLEEKGREEAEATMARAVREIQIASDTAVKNLYTLTANLATDVASRIIRKELNAADHERLVAEALDELETSAIGGNGRE